MKLPAAIARIGLFALLSQSSPLWASCAKSDALSRTLALLYPQALNSNDAACLKNEFEQALEAEKNMGGFQTVDKFSPSAMEKESSLMGAQIYSRRNTVDLKVYRHGDEIYGAHKKLILGAKEEILLQTFVWESESTAAKDIFSGLSELAANRQAECAGDPSHSNACKPLPVIFIVNFGPSTIASIGSLFGVKTHSSKDDLQAGLKGLQIDPKVLDFKVYEYVHDALGLMHAKDIIIDGQVAMITGANVQRFDDPSINWYDTGYIVAGDVVKGMRTDFINNVLRSSAGEERDGDKELARRLNLPYEKSLASVQNPADFMEQPFNNDGKAIPIVITSRDAVGDLFSNSNNSTQNRGFQAAFYSAESKIHIQSPNLNDDAALRGLGQAIKRNVKVDLILSRRFNCKTETAPGQGGDNIEGIKRIVGYSDLSNAHNDQLDARWFTVIKDGQRFVPNDNMKAKGPRDRPLNSHAKFMSVDDKLVIVGSANHDTQSWNHSRELNLMIFDETIAKAWDEQVFGENFDIAASVQDSELSSRSKSCDP